MSAYSKLPLSESTNGKQILIAATASAGTTVHTAVSGTTDIDEVWLWVSNEHTAAVTLTLQWGGTTSPDNDTTVTIPSKSGLSLVAPGLLLQNSLVVKAWASVTNKLLVTGFVNRITG